MSFKFGCLTLFFILFSIASYSQDTLTNKDIIDLKNASFSEKVIISKIESEPGKFDIATKALLDLKKNKISEDVITAMIKKKGANDSNLKTPTKETKQEGQAPLLRRSGIYLKQSTGDLQELEPAIYSAEKQNVAFLSSKSRASVRGANANLIVHDSMPVFYFYFETSGENENLGDQSILFTKAKSPNEFTLVKFDIVPNKNERLIITAKGNFIDGVSSGIDEKQVVAFKYKKIKDGLYEVYFSKGLPKGEYAFMYAGSIKDFGTAGQKVYDFSINHK